MTIGNDKDCGRFSEKNRRKRRSLLVNPQTLKVMMAVGPLMARILRLIIELVKLFKS